MKKTHILLAIFFPHVAVLLQNRLIKRMKHHIDTSDGLWCIDQPPKSVTKNWIEQNAFQLWFNDKSSGPLYAD